MRPMNQLYKNLNIAKLKNSYRLLQAVHTCFSSDPGDHVIAEDYTYLSIPTMVNPLGARYVVVEGDQGGMRPDKLWEGLRKR